MQRGLGGVLVAADGRRHFHQRKPTDVVAVRARRRCLGARICSAATTASRTSSRRIALPSGSRTGAATSLERHRVDELRPPPVRAALAADGRDTRSSRWRKSQASAAATVGEVAGVVDGARNRLLTEVVGLGTAAGHSVAMRPEPLSAPFHRQPARWLAGFSGITLLQPGRSRAGKRYGLL
jgi:hypothetical protein